jgi:hypothetical protein
MISIFIESDICDVISFNQKPTKAFNPFIGDEILMKSSNVKLTSTTFVI